MPLSSAAEGACVDAAGPPSRFGSTTWKVATEEVADKDAAGLVEGEVIAHPYDPDTEERWPGAAAGKLACNKSTAGMTIRLEETWDTTLRQKCGDCGEGTSSWQPTLPVLLPRAPGLAATQTTWLPLATGTRAGRHGSPLSWSWRRHRRVIRTRPAPPRRCRGAARKLAGPESSMEIDYRPWPRMLKPGSCERSQRPCIRRGNGMTSLRARPTGRRSSPAVTYPGMIGPPAPTR